METLQQIRIRPTRQEIMMERLLIKQTLRAQLPDRGDITYLHQLLNEESPISYNTVANALNPNSPHWSNRVIEFARKYIAARDAAKAANNQVNQ